LVTPKKSKLVSEMILTPGGLNGVAKARIERLVTAVSTSDTMNSNEIGWSSPVWCTFRREITGASFTERTFIGMTTLAVAPSVRRDAVMVRLLVPNWFAAVVSVGVMVPLVAVPPGLNGTKITFPLGSSVGLDEEALKNRFVTGVPVPSA